VINMSLVMTADDPSVRAAVARAVARGVVVVAAAGNDGKPDDANLRPYPASYPDVIGVGAIGPDGVAGDFSQHGDWVDLTAPGVDVTFAARRSGHTSGRGTSYASPFVAATAALVKQRFPSLTPAQVARRILATADPAPGGRRSERYGFGVLNPYRALTETLGPETRPAPAPVIMHTEDPAAVALATRRAHAQDMSLLIAAIGVGVVLFVVVVAAALRRGRRRGWRPPDPEVP
jgi:subtilisin family serine protease